MTPRILSGTYNAGYDLKSVYTTVTLTSSGRVGGFGFEPDAATRMLNYGKIQAKTAGADGVSVSGPTYLDNEKGGLITAATAAAAPKYDNGITGGVGVDLAVDTSVSNAGEVFGGAGGVGGAGYSGIYGFDSKPGGYDGGAGGAGMSFGSAGSLLNDGGVVQGGVGGAGGATGLSYGSAGLGGEGGLGGAGVAVSGVGTIDNIGGYLYGGFGGSGGAGRYTGFAGAGGAAVALDGGGYFYTHGGRVLGGDGGTNSHAAGFGGQGGDGIVLSAAGTINAQSVIAGGAGGAGVAGKFELGLGAGADGGDGGQAIILKDSGSVRNGGMITGGAGGAGGIGYAFGGDGGYGGVGVDLLAGGVLFNQYGAIAGGAGGSGGGYSSQGGGTLGAGGVGGAGVVLAGGAILENTGTISGGEGGFGYGPGGSEQFATSGDGVSLAVGGAVTNGPNASAKIRGAIGVYGGTDGATTVTNYGVIYGSTASVVFAYVGDRLIVQDGSSLTGGAAQGGGGTLELKGGSDTITGLGGAGAGLSGSATASFGGFGSYVVGYYTALTLTGSNALSKSQSLTLEPGDTLSAQGSIANAGVIALTGGGYATSLFILSAGATLSGGGRVTLGGTKSEIVGASAAATLTNAGDTLSGVGAIGAGRLTLVNEAGWVIDAVGAGELGVDTKGETLTNAGLIEASAGGVLAISSTTIAQSGGGSILAAGGGIHIEDDVILGGTVGSTGAGVVGVNTSGGEFDGAAGAVTVTGVVEVANGVSLTLVGTIDVTGKLELEAKSTLTNLIIGAGGVSLSGDGDLVLSNSADNIIVGQVATDTLTNVNDHIVGSGLLGDGVLTLVNDKAGVIDGNGTVALTLNTGTKSITNAGTIEALGKGGVIVGGTLDNTGKLYADGGTLTLDGAVVGAGTGLINGGELYAKSTFVEDVAFTGLTGVLELADSRTYSGKITGFSKTGTNSLDLLDIAFGTKTKATYSGTLTSGILSVTDGTHTAKIVLVGNYETSTFTLSSDGHGGTKVVDPTAPPHAFIAAMAGFGAPGGTASAGAEPWRNPAASLAPPNAG